MLIKHSFDFALRITRHKFGRNFGDLFRDQTKMQGSVGTDVPVDPGFSVRIRK